MCSRLCSGSASMPSRPSRLVTVVVMRSLQQLAVLEDRPAGAAKDLRIETGMPGAAARGVDDELGRLAQALDALAVLAPVGQALLPQVGLLRGVTPRRTGPSCARRPR